jgi:hypothetical protein
MKLYYIRDSWTAARLALHAQAVRRGGLTINSMAG